MIPTSYNYGTFYRGDTIPKKIFQLYNLINEVPVPIDLTSATIKCDFVNESNEKIQTSIGSGITVTDASNGTFEIDAFVCTYYGAFKYDIQITFDDGRIRTYVNGTMNILKDVTL